jgi:hypothetical protein
MYPNQYCNPCKEPEPCVPAPPPPDCVGEPCEEIVLDTCVRYTGPAIPCLGIETGVSLNSILQIIAEKLCDCCDGTPPPAPVDCVVSEWSEWSECIEGTQTRTRTVITAAQNGGVECPELEETRECCLPINCVVSEWSEWSECDGTSQTRTRTVITAASCGGIECPSLEETRECCLPVDCVVSEWSVWSECVSGVQTRERIVLTPASCEGLECPTLSESRVCTVPCIPVSKVSATSSLCETVLVSFDDDGSATSLTAELVSQSTGLVVATYTWVVTGLNQTYSYLFSGSAITAGAYIVNINKLQLAAECLPVSSLEVSVNSCEPVINCEVSEWSEWSECVDGFQTRTRTVITPASGGGIECPELTELQGCELPPCPPVTDLVASIN